MWQGRPPDPHEVNRFRVARERLDLHPLAIHVKYLVNLASADPVVRAKSIAAFRGELERAAAIGAEYLVIHPGSCRGRTVEEGIASFALGLREAACGFRSRRVTILIENTAGSGACLGGRLEELQSIRQVACHLTSLPIGYCLDTCHLFAAGFDIATAAGLRDTVRRIDESLGLSHVHLFHANDSKKPLGSRVDRHASIGEGHIGRAAFRRILTHPALRQMPFILETPLDKKGDDRRNLDILKCLAACSRTTVSRVI